MALLLNTEPTKSANINHRARLTLGLQAYVNWTNWKGNKLELGESLLGPGFSGEVPDHFKSDTVAILPYGWLPVGLMDESVEILADKNLLTQIAEKYDAGVPRPDLPASYLDLIKFNVNPINTSFFALEDNKPSPDRAAMKASILLLIKAIHQTMPAAEVTPKGLQSLDAMHMVANRPVDRTAKEILFLTDVAPALSAEIKPADRMKLTQFVAEWAMIHGVTPLSLIFTACISLIWSSKEFNPARAIINPKVTYYADDAVAALDQLRMLELYMLTIAGLDGNNIALLTNNRPLIHFWLALGANGITHNGTSLRFELRLATPLFQEMQPEHYADVQDLFKAASAHEDAAPAEQSAPEEEPPMTFKFDRNIDTRLVQRSAKTKIMNMLKRIKPK